MADSTGAFAEYRRQWLRAQPENLYVELFLEAPVRQRAVAAACLISEVVRCAFGMSDAGVAASKLQWWLHELSESSAGKPRHPLTHMLFAETGAVLANYPWASLTGGAIAQLERAPCPTTQALLDQLQLLFTPIADVEACVLDCSVGSAPDNGRLWAADHVIASLVSTSASAGDVLPLNLLARHRLKRSEIGDPANAVAFNELIRDFLGELLEEMRSHRAKSRMHALPLRARSTLDIAALEAALTAADPVACLRTATQRRGARTLWLVWRAARANRLV